MAKKSKSKSENSEDIKSNGTVPAAAVTLKTDAPVDPLLASLFEKSVRYDSGLLSNVKSRTLLLTS